MLLLNQVGSLLSNYPEVQLQFQEIKPDLLFISETELNPSLPIQKFMILSYSPLLTKDEPLNWYGHDLEAYINDDPDFRFVLSGSPRS